MYGISWVERTGLIMEYRILEHEGKFYPQKKGITSLWAAPFQGFGLSYRAIATNEWGVPVGYLTKGAAKTRMEREIEIDGERERLSSLPTRIVYKWDEAKQAFVEPAGEEEV